MSRFVGSVSMAALLVACVASAYSAEEAKATTVTGVVSAAFDDDWNAKWVKLTTDKKEVINVVIDPTGQKLGWEEGEKVVVTGTLTTKGKEQWLKVATFKLVAAEEEKKEEPKKEEAKEDEAKKPAEKKEAEAAPADEADEPAAEEDVENL